MNIKTIVLSINDLFLPMTNKLLITLLILITSFCVMQNNVQARPSPPLSRYEYVLKFDIKALSKGVMIQEVSDKLGTRHFITNTSDVPLIINESIHLGRIIGGTKLISGKVYTYFPNGVPTIGKKHLKGWQAPFNDAKKTLIRLQREPVKIYEGRKLGLSKEIPKPEKFMIPVKFNKKPFEIKGMIHYRLNVAYDE